MRGHRLAHMMLVAEAVSITVVVALVIVKLASLRLRREIGVAGLCRDDRTLADGEQRPRSIPPHYRWRASRGAKVTTRTELAVAETVNAPEPMARSVRAAKVMVLVPGVIVKFCTTGVAAAKLPLPGCEAVIEQEPPPPRR